MTDIPATDASRPSPRYIKSASSYSPPTDLPKQIDYTKFAQVAGLKTPASARELMRVTKNKLKDEYGALSSGMQSTNGGTNGTPAKAKATPRKRKSKGVGDDEESPTKKVKGKGSESPVKKEQVDGEETEDFFG